MNWFRRLQHRDSPRAHTVPPLPMDKSLETSGLWLQAAALGFQTARMGPRVALEDSGVTFRPEEVTEEMGGCFQEGPGSIWKD